MSENLLPPPKPCMMRGFFRLRFRAQPNTKLLTPMVLARHLLHFVTPGDTSNFPPATQEAMRCERSSSTTLSRHMRHPERPFRTLRIFNGISDPFAFTMEQGCGNVSAARFRAQRSRAHHRRKAHRTRGGTKPIFSSRIGHVCSQKGQLSSHLQHVSAIGN